MIGLSTLAIIDINEFLLFSNRVRMAVCKKKTILLGIGLETLLRMILIIRRIYP